MATNEVLVRLELNKGAEWRVFVGAMQIVADWLEHMTDRAHLVLTSEELPRYLEDVQLLKDAARALEGRITKVKDDEDDGEVRN